MFCALLSSTYFDEQTSKELHKAACGAGRDGELLDLMEADDCDLVISFICLEIPHPNPNDFVGKQHGQPKTIVSCDRFHYT